MKCGTGAIVITAKSVKVWVLLVGVIEISNDQIWLFSIYSILYFGYRNI